MSMCRNDPAADALAKGRRQATAVLNSWVRKGLVERAGTRTEKSGQHATVWRFAPVPS